MPVIKCQICRHPYEHRTTTDVCPMCCSDSDAVPPGHQDRARYLRKLLRRGRGAVSMFLLEEQMQRQFVDRFVFGVDDD